MCLDLTRGVFRGSRSHSPIELNQSLFNGMGQKRPKALVHRFSFEIGDMTLQKTVYETVLYVSTFGVSVFDLNSNQG